MQLASPNPDEHAGMFKSCVRQPWAEYDTKEANEAFHLVWPKSNQMRGTENGEFSSQSVRKASFAYTLISQLMDGVDKNWKDLHVHKDVGKCSMGIWVRMYMYMV